MNKRYTSIFMLLGMITFFGCNPFDSENNDSKNAKVLKEPPFKVITDSIDEFPNDAYLYLKRAELLSQKNFTELAFPDFKKAWTIKPDEPTAVLYAANLFMTGRENQAIDLLKECIKKFPGNNEFPRRLSEAYLQSGKSQEALIQFNQLIKIDSNNFEPWFEKGSLLAQLKDTTQAIRCLEKAYALQPLQLIGVSLANLYAETKNKKALDICNELIVKDTAKELTDAFFIKGIYFANINQFEQALEQFETCINRDWKFTEAYIEKGIILYKDQNIDEALKTFELASRVSNTYPDAYYWMGRCYENIGKKQEARENYMRALSLDKNFEEAKQALRKLR
ncbi:MAG: tetratricopeptide repeat protein [Chitinophagaceae bacterium]